MAQGSSVNFYTHKVKLVVKGAEQKILTAAAISIADRAAVNVAENEQIDTGFMWNAIYAVSPLMNGRAAAEADAKSRADRGFGPDVTLPNDETAAVHGAAEYTIFQEMRRPFMYPALVAEVSTIGGLIRERKI